MFMGLPVTLGQGDACHRRSRESSIGPPTGLRPFFALVAWKEVVAEAWPGAAKSASPPRKPRAPKHWPATVERWMTRSGSLTSSIALGARPKPALSPRTKPLSARASLW